MKSLHARGQTNHDAENKKELVYEKKKNNTSPPCSSSSTNYFATNKWQDDSSLSATWFLSLSSSQITVAHSKLHEHSVEVAIFLQQTLEWSTIYRKLFTVFA